MQPAALVKVIGLNWLILSFAAEPFRRCLPLAMALVLSAIRASYGDMIALQWEEIPPLKMEGQSHQANQHRHLNQRSYNGGESLAHPMPNTDMATAMAISKLLLAAVNPTVAAFE